KRVAELRRVVPDADDRAGPVEAQIDGAAAAVLPVANAAHDVVRLLGQRLDAADVVRVSHGETRVVEDSGGHGQRQALDQGQDLVSGARGPDVGAADEQWPLGIEQRVPDGLDDADLGNVAHVWRVRSLHDRLDVR